MANKWGGLPTIVSNIPNDMRNYLQRVRETLDGAMAGANRFVSVSELVNGGIASFDPFGNIKTTDTSALDFTPPPAATGFIAVGALTTIMLEWDDPKYSNFAYAELWRSSVDNQGIAVLIGTSTGVMYADSVDAGSSYYYWVRFISKANVIGAFNATAGVLGTTSIDPTALLALLAGEITDSQLHADLGARINLIDAPGTGLVTKTTQLASDTAAVQQETTANSSAITGLSAQWTVKLDVGGKVSGFGLSSTSPVSGAGTSIFEIRADKIAFAAPEGSSAESAVPFVVDTVNNRVAMDGAYIKNATIGAAQIANLSVDDAKISSVSANKMTAGAIAVGEYIESTNYVSGYSGWRIYGDGSAELNNIYARGNIRATSFSQITLQTGEHIKQGQTAYDTGTGFYLGEAGGAPKFSLGVSGESGITWDGLVLTVKGKISGSSEINVGSFNGYAWPDSGSGVHISASGILAGNPNVGGGKYFNIHTPADGDMAIYTNIPAYIGDASVSSIKIAGGAVSETGNQSTGAGLVTSNIAVSAADAATSLFATGSISFDCYDAQTTAFQLKVTTNMHTETLGGASVSPGVGNGWARMSISCTAAFRLPAGSTWARLELVHQSGTADNKSMGFFSWVEVKK